ncbi:hypothetical protein FSP39_013197 [Pinctada imbricata]|uniref:Integrase core domain-containing protein n=1 Tax=Pinctada imbricata TaxID=66713 RepID=A0AA88YKG6_PINIB|nr:hypothetical protein FSP39_013197 [Pinctada imbricata]
MATSYNDKEDRDTLIQEYFNLGLKYKDISHLLLHENDIVLSVRQIKRILRNLRLSRRNYSEGMSVVEFIQRELRSSGQLHGYRIMWTKCKENGFNVRVYDVRNILQLLDPVGVSLRSARRLRRRSYYASGPNFIWHIDGYDKLKPFGLCIHGCIDGYSRKMIWLKAYHTNNDPKIIGGYFIEAIEEYGGCPRFVRGDFGTENGHVCSFQSILIEHDNSRSFIYGASTTNQRIESWWGYLRREHMQYWIALLRNIQERGEYSGDFLDKNLMLFCFLGPLQKELDTAAKIWDAHYIRPSSNPRVPYGKPELMFKFPSLWGTAGYDIDVSEDRIAICKSESKFRSTIPCDEDVFDICVNIMKTENLMPAKDVNEAETLYLCLRQNVLSLMNT